MRVTSQEKMAEVEVLLVEVCKHPRSTSREYKSRAGMNYAESTDLEK